VNSDDVADCVVNLKSVHEESSLETSSVVTQMKDEKLSGEHGGGTRGETEVRLISKLALSL